MKKTEIMIGTVTLALKGRDILRDNGFKAHIERKSYNIGKYGCGYSVVVTEEAERAVSILKENGIKVLNVIKTAAR